MTGVAATPGKQMPIEVQCSVLNLYAALDCNTDTGSSTIEWI